MGKVIKLAVHAPEKFGLKKVRKRKRINLEDYGQLNLFNQDTAKVLSLPGRRNFFEEAIELDESNNPEAERYYLLAVENEESVEDALCNLAILKSSQDNAIAAVDFLTQCLQRSPRHFEAHYNLANVYSDLSDFELAKVHYELASQIAPEFPNSFYNLGLVLISLKEYERAIECINHYVSLSPDTDTSTAKELITTLNAMAK
ncbi:MAG: hypothetical protein GY816_02005 [Cytophagales bacterium]|nr:hypothetical protein [Cytophagales bacterium]